MKKKYILLNVAVIILLFGRELLIAQNITATFQPDGTTGQDAYIANHSTNINNAYPTYDGLMAQRWSAGETFTARSLLKFDLSTIPSVAVVVSATLDLYGVGHDVNYLSNPTVYKPNAFFINRITSSWNNTVTWTTQPTTTTVSQIACTASTTTTQNYSLDVKTHVQNMIQTPSGNYGWMIQLQDEVNTYARIKFGSSDQTTASSRPKLTVVYYIPVPTVTNMSRCGSGPVTMIPSGSTGTYRWYTTPSGTTSIVSGTTLTVTPSSTTTYYVSAYSGTNESAKVPLTITINPLPTADAGVASNIQKGESVTLGAQYSAGAGTPPYTLAWTPASTLSSPTVNNPLATPSATTTYTLTVTDSKSCTATQTVTVNVDAQALNYAPLTDKLDAGYYSMTNGILNFKFKGMVNNGTLNYKIYNESRTDVTDNFKISNKMVFIGDNNYTLSAINGANGSFLILEVKNERNEVSMLRFKY